MILRQRQQSRKGVILLAVLVVVVLLSLAAYKYSDYMLSETRGTHSAIRSAQAREFADSGVHYTAALLAGQLEGSLAYNPYENPEAFQNIPIPSTETNVFPGRFTILSLRSPDDALNRGTPYSVGVSDESAKINVNGLLALDRNRGDRGLQVLKGLPNMNEDIAKSILAWLGAQAFQGTEAQYYSTQSPPYRMKLGPLDSLEELLLVRGVTPQLLFGNDRNRNGIIDPDEDGGSGVADLGWSAYLTVYSREANADSTGVARININDANLETMVTNLTAAVGPELTNYIVAYRMYGGKSTSDGKQRGPTAPAAKMSDSDAQAVMAQLQTAQAGGGKKKLRRIRSLWDLVNSEVTVTVGQGKSAKSVSYPSPLNDSATQRQLLPLLLDKCTTSRRTDLRARVNVMTASQTVLNCFRDVSGITDADIQSIVSKRPQPDQAGSDPLYRTAAWLITEAGLPVATVRRLDPYVTGRTQVYRFQSMGYFERGGPVARIEAVVDTNLGRPRIVYWRDLSELGRGFELPRQEQQQ